MRYTSSFALLGLPLVDVRVGAPLQPGASRSVARGWFAVGDLAVGVVVSLGGAAFGGVAIGGVAVGIIPIGGAAAGLLAIGGAAFGVWALGGAAFGLLAALGGLAVAASYAQGGLAVARHANDAAAATFFSTGHLFPILRACLQYSRWSSLLLLLPLLPFLLKRRGDV